VSGQPARHARGSTSRAPSQHFLRSPRIAAALVRDAGVGPEDLVVEIGAGSGRLTAPLAERAAEVLAIELDPVWAGRLRERFRGFGHVVVLEADAASVALPRRPFRVVSNLPFHRTGELLRHLLDDPSVPLVQADVIVEWGVAVKRSACWPSTMRSVLWGTRFELAVVRRLPPRCFEPAPQVEAAVLRAVRRAEPLVPGRAERAFRALVEAGFRTRARDLRSALAHTIPPRAFRRAARELGLGTAAHARDLDIHQWVALFDAVHRGRYPSARHEPL
jgi:23S rRNA (adenine-N6)-dimethyltransferase